MGLFVMFSSEELQEFEQWRKANAAGGQVIVIEPVSERRPNRFKVWFEKPMASTSNLRWYKPIKEADGASEVSATRRAAKPAGDEARPAERP